MSESVASSHVSNSRAVSHARDGTSDSASEGVRELLPFLPPSSDKTAALPAESYQVQEDAALGWFYKPHSITALLITIAIMIYFGWTSGDHTEDETVKIGIGAVIVAFLFFSMLQLRDGPFVRPHPAFWRVVLGVSIVYLMALVFVFFQSHEKVQKILHFWYPELGLQDLPDRSYADDCRLYTPGHEDGPFANIKGVLFDRFVLAHIGGWFAKALMFRDYFLAWTLSFVFEMMEYSFEHMLKNFRECWWDHFIVDLLICNGVGIWLGMRFCRFLQMQEYNWTAIRTTTSSNSSNGGNRHSLSSTARHSVNQLLPAHLETFEWNIFGDPKRFFAFVSVVVGVLFVDLNAFFLKDVLWVPPESPLNQYRLVLWFICGTPALREYYQYVTDPRCKKLGTQLWVTFAIIITELLVIVKFGMGRYDATFYHPPAHIVWGWSIALVSLVVWFVWFFYIGKGKERRLERAGGAKKSN